MKKAPAVLLAVLLSLTVAGCAGRATSQPPEQAILEAVADHSAESTRSTAEESEAPVKAQAGTVPEETQSDGRLLLEITVNGEVFFAELYDHETTRALMEQMPMSVEMSELNGNEKYVILSERLPTDSQQPSQIHAGDLMLYGSDCLVLFYKSFATPYSYTPLGRVEDPTGLAEALGSDAAQVSFGMRETTASQPSFIKANDERIIRISTKDDTILFQLNDSQAARDLYAQLPLTTDVENFSSNEKVFYPPEKLDTRNTPLADADKGTLAYYAPWGDVVIFYDHFGSGNGLYELGQAVSGGDQIEALSGTIEVTAEG